MSRLQYGLYVRKSTESADRQVLSIEAQIRKAKEIFPELAIAKRYEERQSAFEPGKRPVFQSLLDDIDAGKVDGIIAWHPDRLSRNEEEAARVTYRVRKGVIRDLVFCSYHFINSPEGIMMLQLALSQSQYYSAKLGKDVIRGLEQKVEMGWRPGVPPIGYLNDVVRHTIVSDPERFGLVRRMWDVLLTETYTPPRIVQVATDEWGLTTRYGGGPVARSNAYKLFRNPFYAGYILHNGGLHKGKHEAMVTIPEFQKAQGILDRTSRLSHKLIRRQFPYTGLITCEECGCQYTAEIKKGHAYYHCTRHKRAAPCSQTKNMREETIDATIQATLERHSIQPILKAWALDHLARTRDLGVKQDAEVRQSRLRRIAELKERVDGLIDMSIKKLLTDDAFTERHNAAQAEIDDLSQQVELADERKKKVDQQVRRLLDLATYGVAVLKHGSIRKRRIIAHALGQAFTARDGQLMISVREWIVPIGEFIAKTKTGTLDSVDGDLQVEFSAMKLPTGSRYARTNEILDNGSMDNKISAFAPTMLLWLGTIDKVRTVMEKRPDEVNLPEFNELGDLMDDG